MELVIKAIAKVALVLGLMLLPATGARASASALPSDPPKLRDLVRSATQSTVAVFVMVGSPGRAPRLQSLAGSGVTLGTNLVLTCAHVVAKHPNLGAGEKQYTHVVRDSDWRTGAVSHPATVVYIDENMDVAVLKVPGLQARPAPVGEAARLEVGDEVFFIGHPDLFPFRPEVGLANKGPALGTGVIAAIESMPGRNVKVFRIDGNVNPGNSGGGLFTREKGELVGVVNARAGVLGSGLQSFRDTLPRASLVIGGVDQGAVLRQTLAEVEKAMQLGAGYAIAIDQIGLKQAGVSK